MSLTLTFVCSGAAAVSSNGGKACVGAGASLKATDSNT